MDIEKTEIFPTEIYSFTSTTINNDAIVDALLKMEQDDKSVQLSNRGGWQSNGDLTDDSVLSQIPDAIGAMFGAILPNLGYPEGHSKIVTITGLWGNVNRYKDFNMSHCHPGRDWSFCYYAKAHENCGDIVFEDPRSARSMMRVDRETVLGPNRSVNVEWNIAPETGKMIVFPAYLKHYVEPNMTDEPRVSIAGNIAIGDKV